MTKTPGTGIDPAMTHALNRFSVPAPSTDFADRIMQAALDAPVLPAPVGRRRPARDNRRWARGRNIVIGTVAFGLMSATAAAAGLFGDIAVRVPVIGRLIAAAAPDRAPVKAVKVKRAVKAQDAAVPGALAVSPTAPAAQDWQAQRGEIVAERIINRVERRDAQRAAAGLPPRAPRLSKAAAVLREATPEQRAVMIEKMRGALQERRAAINAGETPPPARLLSRIAPPQAGMAQALADRAAPDAAEPDADADERALPARDTLRDRATTEQLRQLRELREQRRRLRQQRRR